MLTMLLLALFGLMMAYACYSVYFYGGRWISNPYNLIYAATRYTHRNHPKS